jgi:ribosomal protein S18 acetylase RimI-like enzyme
MSPIVTRRPVEPADEPLLYQLYAGTRADELSRVPWSPEEKAAFVRMQFDAQHRHYQEHYVNASFDVVLVDGEPAGRLYVDRGRDEIRLIEITMLPTWRNRGLGSGLILALQREAEAGGTALTVHVERFNPALRLYERLGFVMLEERGPYLFLEWRAESAPPGDCHRGPSFR